MLPLLILVGAMVSCLQFSINQTLGNCRYVFDGKPPAQKKEELSRRCAHVHISESNMGLILALLIKLALQHWHCNFLPLQDHKTQRCNRVAGRGQGGAATGTSQLRPSTCLA